MPTALSHAAAPLALRLGLGRSVVSGRLLAAGLAASMVPDADVVGFRFGIDYADDLGHRGLTHSLAFAACVALVGALNHRALRSRFLTAFAFLLAAAVSHPLLDALTDGGLGVALFWPFSSERVFAPFSPIRVAPLSLEGLLLERGVGVAVSELRWVWLPCAALGALIALLRRKSKRDSRTSPVGQGPGSPGAPQEANMPAPVRATCDRSDDVRSLDPGPACPVGEVHGLQAVDPLP